MTAQEQVEADVAKIRMDREAKEARQKQMATPPPAMQGPAKRPTGLLDWLREGHKPTATQQMMKDMDK